MIGDNPVADVESAKAAGLSTILVHNPAESNADYAFASLKEVAALLRKSK